MTSLGAGHRGQRETVLLLKQRIVQAVVGAIDTVLFQAQILVKCAVISHSSSSSSSSSSSASKSQLGLDPRAGGVLRTMTLHLSLLLGKDIDLAGQVLGLIKGGRFPLDAASLANSNSKINSGIGK